MPLFIFLILCSVFGIIAIVFGMIRFSQLPFGDKLYFIYALIVLPLAFLARFSQAKSTLEDPDPDDNEQKVDEVPKEDIKISEKVEKVIDKEEESINKREDKNVEEKIINRRREQNMRNRNRVNLRKLIIFNEIFNKRHNF